jgi:ATP adenylyltransferase
MVIPFRHTAELKDLPSEEKLDLLNVLQKSVDVLKEVYHPEGFNIGMNLGRAAGAGIDQHLHMHIVPRWSGDTNFMTILADTKVVSESLDQGYRQLFKVFHGS